LQINFFAEPTKAHSLEETLQKARLMVFDSPPAIRPVAYLATKGYDEFQLYREKLREINPQVEAGYWPILAKSYWPSPLSYPWELKKLRMELEKRSPKEPLKVLVDLEPPMLNKELLLFNLPNLWQNKNEIRNLLNDAGLLNIEITTAEYALFIYQWRGLVVNKTLRYLGFSYAGGHHRIAMFYTSMLSRRKQEIVREGIKCNNRNLWFGLGTTGIGALGNEPPLSPEDLEKDLLFMEENGVTTVFIFQLSGLNESYLEIMKKF